MSEKANDSRFKSLKKDIDKKKGLLYCAIFLRPPYNEKADIILRYDRESTSEPECMRILADFLILNGYVVLPPSNKN